MGYIVPGSGIVNDNNEGFGIIIPGFGIYNTQVIIVIGGGLRGKLLLLGVGK